MTKVYRSVPLLEDTISKHEKLNPRLGNMESKLYELGIIPFENVYSFFHTNGDSALNTFSYKHEHYKSFFLFPIDAVIKPFTTIERYCYNHKRWEILEYDIPDDILLNFCGYGYYNEKTIVEFSIPESAFNVSDKIEDIVLKKKINDILNQTILENLDNGFDQKEITKFLDTTRSAYFSSFITGNKIIIKRDEVLNENKNDFINDEDAVKLLKEKGIKCSNFLPLYYELMKYSNDVNHYKEEYLNFLRVKLKENLHNLFSEEKKLFIK